MKYLSGFIAMASLLASASVFAADARHCADLEYIWGTRCNSSESLIINTTNNCAETIYIRTCLERKDGRWDCGTHSNMRPGQSSGHYTCHATGEYQRAACTGGYAECGFPTP